MEHDIKDALCVRIELKLLMWEQLPRSLLVTLAAERANKSVDEAKALTKNMVEERDRAIADGKVAMLHRVAQMYVVNDALPHNCLLYTSPSPRDKRQSRMPSSA